MSFTNRSMAGIVAALVSGTAFGAVSPEQLEAATAKVDASVIAWRRDIHQHPELGNRETRTAALVAAHLKKLGLEVTTGVAYTGVTAVLRGGKPGPTVALRADMDALPVTEQTDVPFRSTVKSEFMGKQVGVMHACGHDAHTAILMGIAQALASVKADLPGTVLFIFQPAEEGPPEGEEGGASLMIKEGLFAKVKPDAVFGLHVAAAIPSGVIGYRSGPFMAGADTFQIDVTGRQAHGSRPWSGIDPIVIGSQIVVGLQTIVSRQVDITELPAVVTVGQFDSGVRQNIIPDTARLRGTIRTFDAKVRSDIIERMRRTTENIATAGGGKATLTVSEHSYPVVVNNPDLVARTLPTLQRVAGQDKVVVTPLQTGAEDFAFYAQFAPSFFFYVGVTPPATDVANAATNHSPLFYIDEPALRVATRALLGAAVDYLQGE